MEEKNYINGLIVKENSFNNGGKILKVSVRVADLFDQLKSIEKNGWANLNIAKRKEPSDKGVTHYVYEDTWQPEKNYNDTNDPQYDDDVQVANIEDLPF